MANLGIWLSQNAASKPEKLIMYYSLLCSLRSHLCLHPRLRLCSCQRSHLSALHSVCLVHPRAFRLSTREVLQLYLRYRYMSCACRRRDRRYKCKQSKIPRITREIILVPFRVALRKSFLRIPSKPSQSHRLSLPPGRQKPFYQLVFHLGPFWNA
jgi:hypothetical protein